MRLLAQTATLTSALDSLKVKNAELSLNLTESKAKHENEMSSLRRAQAGLQRDRSDLQRHLEDLKTELSKRPEQAQESLEEAGQMDDIFDGEESITPINQSPSRSPQLSPIKNTPSRNAPLELETTKSSLHHAHRMVNNLRNNLHREKTEKLELKRLLAAAQDEVEQLRLRTAGNKRAGKRPQVKRSTVDMLGSSRRPRQEFTFPEDPTFANVDWNDDADSNSAAYVTANEEEGSDTAFITATENTDGTDTDAYRTGLESPVDSEDDGELTETESDPSRQSSSHMGSLGYIREISPSIAFTSDEEDSPVRLPQLLRTKRSTVRTDNGRRVASSQFDPPPQPLFNELMEGGGSSVVNSPVSALDSPTTSHGTAVPGSPLLMQRFAGETTDIGVQCEPIPDPEPIVIQAPPVIIYKEREEPPSCEASTQSDPVLEPEPVVVEAPPIIIYREPEKPVTAEAYMQSDPLPDPEPIVVEAPPITIFVERELPPSTDAHVQTEPIPLPEPLIIRPDPILIQADPIIITKLVEAEKPRSVEASIQSDPIPQPEPVIIRPDPIVIQAEPIVIAKYLEPEKPVTVEASVQSDIVIYEDRVKPELTDMGSQCDSIPIEPVVIYKERETSTTSERYVQSDLVNVSPNLDKNKTTITKTVEVQSSSQSVGHWDKDVQTAISIPLMDSYQFDHQSLTGILRPKTPNLTLRESVPNFSSSRAVDSPVAATPKTFQTSSPDWDNTPKSPLKEITNAQGPRSMQGSPSRSSIRNAFSDSPSTFSSRAGSVRRYNTILEHPTLHPSPRSTVTRSRMSLPASPSKLDQRRHQTISSSHSRGNISIASRPTTGISRRTSLSSFESEVDHRFGLNHDRNDDIGEGQYATSTDPRVIQAITKTMIGEFLYKYTRDQLKRSKISENRHKRFFWVHPYTKTLYWSSDNPAASKESNRNTRSGIVPKDQS